MLILWPPGTWHMGVWSQGKRREAKMTLRIIVSILLGMLITGSIAAPLANSECELCGGDGNLECPACGGIGAVPHFFLMECSCGGQPDCPFCSGLGYYPSLTTSPCEQCDGKGWIPCGACSGDGKRNLLERIPDLWRGKLEYQE